MTFPTPAPVELAGTILFALAVLHTFSTGFFERLAEKSMHHKGFWHLLAEVEVVFGFWAMLFAGVYVALEGVDAAMNYLDKRDYTEPAFVFAVMVAAATRPVLDFAERIMRTLAFLLPVKFPIAFYFVCLTVGPLLGSLITEPAAMTLTALLLYQQFFKADVSERFKYATLAVLFVNVSIGGVLTHFAAPPVVMVASKWGWGIAEMFLKFGVKAIPAVLLNALLAAVLFRKELAGLTAAPTARDEGPAPLWTSFVHLGFLAALVILGHHPKLFLAVLLFFIGFVEAYERHQDELFLRNALLVGFFLAGLTVLGGMQKWWLSPLLSSLSDTTLFIGATALTGVTDNAALTYLASLVDSISDSSKYAVAAGAVTGGGLTVIANAPNPAGYSILRHGFSGGAINGFLLLAYAIIPTLVAAAAFQFLPGPR